MTLSACRRCQEACLEASQHQVLALGRPVYLVGLLVGLRADEVDPLHRRLQVGLHGVDAEGGPGAVAMQNGKSRALKHITEGRLGNNHNDNNTDDLYIITHVEIGNNLHLQFYEF